METLLRIREQIKAKKPKFVRQKAFGLKKLSKKWKAPKGQHSKLRKKLRGHLKHPSVGYSSPREVRGLTSNGLKPVLINSEKEFGKIDKKVGLIISSKVGERKRIQILKKIEERGFLVLNIKDVDKYIKKIEEKISERKRKKKESEEKKEISKKKIEESSKQSNKKEETPEEKEKREKEEKRRILEGKK